MATAVMMLLKLERTLRHIFFFDILELNCNFFLTQKVWRGLGEAETATSRIQKQGLSSMSSLGFVVNLLRGHSKKWRPRFGVLQVIAWYWIGGLLIIEMAKAFAKRNSERGILKMGASLWLYSPTKKDIKVLQKSIAANCFRSLVRLLKILVV